MADNAHTMDKLLPSPTVCAQDMLDSIRAGVIVLDPSRRLVYANAWLVDATGQSVEQLIATPLSDLLADPNRMHADRALDRLFATGQTVGWEAHILGSKTELIAEFTAKPTIQEDGDIVAVQVSCLDITPYHRAMAATAHYREELERQQKESSALYSIGVSCTLSMDLDEVLRLIYLHVGSLFTFSTFGILLYDATTREISAELLICDGHALPQRRWSLDTDHGLIGHVIRTSRPLLLRDWPQEADQYPVSEDTFADPDMRAWLSVPLVGKERVLGVLCLQHREADAFSEADQRSLYGIADQATMIIENARLHKQTEQQLQDLQKANNEMQALQDLSRVLQSSLDLHNVLSFIVNGVSTWLDCTLVVLALVNEGSHTLTVRAVAAQTDLEEISASLYGVTWQISDTPPNVTSSLTIRAASEAKIATTESLHELFRPQIGTDEADKIRQSLHIHALVTAPLLSHDRLVGNLIIGTDRDKVTAHEISLLGAFAGQSAMAVENAQMYEAQRRRVRQLETVRDIGQQIASYLGLDELLTNTVELVRARLGYDRVRLFLKDEQRKVLTLCAQSPHDPDLPECVVVLDQDGDSLVGWVAQHGQSRLIDRHEDPGTAAGDGGSELAVVIWFGDQILGVIDVQRSAVDAFDEGDLFILESVSNQVAAGIENAKLYDTVNAQLAEVSTLYMLAEQISSSLETSVVLDSVTDILKQVLNCRGCVIFLFDENREWLEVQVSSGIKPYWQSQARMRLGEGIAGRVAQTAQPIYIPDTQSEPDFKFFDPAVRSLLVVPLIYKGQVIGTLDVDDDKPDAFAGGVERLLSIAATQAAVAIENARLFEALEERAEQLQESNQLKSEFVQNMSHELRTPLTFVKGYVELFLAGTLGKLTDTQQEKMQIVAERTDRVIDMVNDILALQQVERGGVHFAVVHLEQVARAEVRSARAIAQQEGLILIEDYAPDLNPVFGDRERLGRVLVNLIGNAIKFTPPGGTITVRIYNAGDFVQADVIDQGIGIAQDELDKIFGRFYQVDGSSKRRFGGTGLGLAIAKEIITAHGGKITVSSEPGKGSTFSLAVPVATKEVLLTAGLDPSVYPSGQD